MKKMISIIIPFYCTPKTLFQKCIDSVLIDGVDNIEALVIDDGSPEEGRDTLQQVVTGRNIRVIYAPHRGVSAARNRGISEAQGEWITFVDSDDYVNRETLCKIANNIDSFSGDVELFNGGLDQNGLITRNTSFLKEGYNYGERPEDKRAIMESALSAGILPKGYVQKFSYGSPYCKLIKREFLLSNHLLFDESVKFAEDALFLLNVYIHARRIYYNESYLYNYVDNEQSVTRKFRPGISNDMDVFFAQVKKLLSENKLFADLENAYYVRAQFEVYRSFYLEFFNLLNEDKDVAKNYKAFISKEPYKTALDRQYLSAENFRQRIFQILAKNGYGNIYKLIRKLKS